MVSSPLMHAILYLNAVLVPFSLALALGSVYNITMFYNLNNRHLFRGETSVHTVNTSTNVTSTLPRDSSFAMGDMRKR